MPLINSVGSPTPGGSRIHQSVQPKHVLITKIISIIIVCSSADVHLQKVKRLWREVEEGEDVKPTEFSLLCWSPWCIENSTASKESPGDACDILAQPTGQNIMYKSVFQNHVSRQHLAANAASEQTEGWHLAVSTQWQVWTLGAISSCKAGNVSAIGRILETTCCLCCKCGMFWGVYVFGSFFLFPLNID